MSMVLFNARRIWPQPMDVSIGRARFRTIAADGTVGVRFMMRLFPSDGRAMDFEGRPTNSSSTMTTTLTDPVLVGSGGYAMQAWWTFQYDLSIGGMRALSRIRGGPAFASFRIQGLHNIIQSFDIVPDERRGRPHTAMFRAMRGDGGTRGAAAWEWEFEHDRTIRDTRSGPSIVTSTRCVLPVRFSGSLSAEVSASVGAEMGWELGPVASVSGSVGASAGASVDMSFGRSFEIRLLSNIQLNASR